MSMHKIPLTITEELGLRAHGLDIGTPSQLSDAFRLGVAWGQKAEHEANQHTINLLKLAHERAAAECFRLNEWLQRYEPGSPMILNKETCHE